MNKIGNKLPKVCTDAPTEIAVDFDKAFSEISLIAVDLCPSCGGSGGLKAMQSMAVIGGSSVRGPDTTTKCNFCNGTGRR